MKNKSLVVVASLCAIAFSGCAVKANSKKGLFEDKVGFKEKFSSKQSVLYTKYSKDKNHILIDVGLERYMTNRRTIAGEAGWINYFALANDYGKIAEPITCDNYRVEGNAKSRFHNYREQYLATCKFDKNKVIEILQGNINEVYIMKISPYLNSNASIENQYNICKKMYDEKIRKNDVTEFEECLENRKTSIPLSNKYKKRILNGIN